MKERPQELPLGEPVRVGKCAYQLFSETWPDGNVRFFAKVGRPFEAKQTGRAGVLNKMYLGSVGDFIRAAQESEDRLEVIRRSREASGHEKIASVRLELVSGSGSS